MIDSVYPNLQRENAFDFGCGLRRLSFGLAQHFQNVTGVDISPSMLHQAANNSRAPEKVQFKLNESDRLEAIESNAFDLVLSLIVLQHIPRKFIKGYLAEFLRIAKPGGLVVFQLPTRKRKRSKPKLELWSGKPLNWDQPTLPKRCYRAIRRFFRWIPRWIVHSFHHSETWHWIYYTSQQCKGNAVMQMNITSIPRLKRLLKNEDGEILQISEDARAGDDYESHTFFVRKSNHRDE